MTKLRYRVRREARKTFLVVDTATRKVVATHKDPHEAHLHAGTLNYQLRSRRLQTTVMETQSEGTPHGKAT